jgi:hypothetical protein
VIFFKKGKDNNIVVNKETLRAVSNLNKEKEQIKKLIQNNLWTHLITRFFLFYFFGRGGFIF